MAARRFRPHWQETTALFRLCEEGNPDPYPHIEGSKTPMERFDRSLDEAGAAQATRNLFCFGNFARMLGLPAEPSAWRVAAE